jgi:hypothetical protein
MISKHLSEKGDEFAFCRQVCSSLWQDHLNVPYLNGFETWDKVLREIFSDSGYRDHFLHEFQVFLMGTYIIDKIKPALDQIELPYEDIGKTWLLASTFHDVAYPIQKYNDFSREFFKAFLSVDNLAPLELKSHVIQDSLLSCLGEIICYFLLRHRNKKETPARWHKEKDLVQFFHKKVTESLNHGVIAGISLLKIAELHNISEEIIRSIFLPAALAISLHHRGWKCEKGGKEEDILKALKLKNDPISYILIFCDAVQEWGRPRSNGVSGKASEKDFELKHFHFEKNKFNFKIWNANYTMTQSFWIEKDDELKSLQGFLTPNKAIANFCCQIEDKNEKSIDRDMMGPGPRTAV